MRSFRGAVLGLCLLLSLPALAQPAREAPGVDAQWWQEVAERIELEEYAVRRADASGGAHRVHNRAHRFTATLDEVALTVRPEREDASWSWRLALMAWGRERDLRPVAEGSVSSRENRVELQRGTLTEWYVNSPEGLEQGFTIPHPPAGAGGQLVLDLQLETELKPRFSEDGQAIDFFEAGSVSVLRYAKLHVDDASGQVIPARFQSIPHGIRIAIDDSAAVYPIRVDPLATSPAWIGSGDQHGASYGASLATAGDVNGDGYSDVLVGAYLHDGGAGVNADRGRAYLYLGSANGLAATPAWSGTGDENGAGFGSAVASAGDVNGDGFADALVGAYQHDAGGGTGADRGRVYLYYGHPGGLAAFPAWVGSGGENGAGYGFSVATAGDVDGDGDAEVLVGAYAHDAGAGLGANRGRAYLYEGLPNGPAATASWSASGDENGSNFGFSLGTAGDVNADGYADVVVGAYLHDAGAGAGADRGRAYVYLGSPSGLATTVAWTTSGDENGSRFGTSTSTAGDVDGDGFAEVIVGASHQTEIAPGRAFLYPGSSSGLATHASWVGSNFEGGGRFGGSVATAGDVNGDGYADVLVGAYGDDAAGGAHANRGRAYLFLGSPGGLAPHSWSASGDENGALLGYSVATAGDVDGDGYSDVLVGAYGHDAGGGTSADRGRAYLHLGSAAGLASSPAWIVTGEADATQYGHSVATAGDVNGDGYSDVLVGAYSYDAADAGGRVYLYLGSAGGITTTADWTASGDEPHSHFGYTVATAGDVNGDGYSDVLVGANYHDGSGSGPGASDPAPRLRRRAPDPVARGRVYLYLGSVNGLGSEAAWVATGDEADAEFGRALATAGDVNGDGYSDVVVGAPAHDADAGANTNRGRAYLFLGSPQGLEAEASWVGSGESNVDTFGSSVSTAGDVNRDGYSDVVVGARAHATGRGRAYLFLGSGRGLEASAAWIRTGDESHAQYGAAVASAGDVNGDGYSDVIVAAPTHDAGAGTEVYRGRAYVYLGSTAGLGTSPIWTASGEQDDAWFGHSVASAGDVDGDGLSDVLVGGYKYDASRGRVNLYLGIPGGLAAAPAWTAAGEVTSWFGVSVASAGDVNGDGYSDAIVGALLHPGGGISRGRAYLYLGNAGGGRARIPRQARTDSTTPIALLGKSDAETEFRVRMQGITPAGRGRVRLEWEAKPLGTPFTGTGIDSSASTDTGSPGVAGSATSFNEPVLSLDEGTFYHWRARTVSADPYFPRSPWMALAGNNITETKLRTAGCVDRDGDGYGDFGDPSCTSLVPDCDDENASLWGTPAEVLPLHFADATHLEWATPEDPGAPVVDLVYDLLRSGSASNFLLADCVESDDGPNTFADDLALPSTGQVFYYLVRAQNACTDGVGTLGTGNTGTPRVGRSCP